MSDELRPCPFCGASVKMHFEKGLGYIVSCPSKHDKCVIGPATDFHKTREDAYAKWNARPVEDAQAQRIARLERVLAAVDARLASEVAGNNLEAVALLGFCGISVRSTAQMRRVIAAALGGAE